MEHLTVCVLSQEKAAVLSDLTKFSMECDCQIMHASFTNIGTLTLTTLVIQGPWNEIAKFETHLDHIEEKYKASIIFERSEFVKDKNGALPYTLYITGFDRKGVLHEVIKFVENHGAKLNDIVSEVNYSRKTDTPILSISSHITLPTHTSIADFREQFFMFCDNLNLDGMIEAEKN